MCNIGESFDESLLETGMPQETMNSFHKNLKWKFLNNLNLLYVNL